MRDDLSSLFSSLASQARVNQPALRTAAHDRASDAAREEFSLPPEPRERSAPERSRERSNEARSRDLRGAGSARDTAPRREDPPGRAERAWRSDERGASDRADRSDRLDRPDRPDRVDPPRRLDPPRGAGRVRGEEPPRRDDPPGTGKAEEAACGEVVASDQAGAETGGETGEAGATEATAEIATAACEEGCGDETAAAEATALLANVTALPDLVPVATTAPDAATQQAAPAAAPEQTEVSGVAGVQGPQGSSAVEAAATQPALTSPTSAAMADAGPPPTGGPAAGLAEAFVDLPQPTLSETGPSQAGVPQAADAIPLSSGHESLEVTPADTPGMAAQASEPAASGGAGGGADPAAAAVTSALHLRPDVQPAQQTDTTEGTAPGEEATETIGAVRGQDRAAGQHPAHAAETGTAADKPDAANSAGRDGARAEAGAAARPAGPEQPAQASSQSNAAPAPHFASHLAATGSDGQAAAAAQAHRPDGRAHVVADVPLGAVPIEIGLKTLAGINRFEIRLDPVELGRIDVSLEIDDKGEVKAHLTVDKVETLALLQRDARTLERAFEQAGLKSSDGGVNLSLRDQQQHQGQGRQQSGEGRDGPRFAGTDAGRDNREAAPPPPRRIWRGTAGVDVRI